MHNLNRIFLPTEGGSSATIGLMSVFHLWTPLKTQAVF